MATFIQQAKTNSVYQWTPAGQERLATQPERDDVNRMIGVPALEERTKAPSVKIEDRSDARELGDQVNRFLLCTLVTESSKHIKASAQRAGESLPMTKIVRGVLRSYRLAAMDKSGPLSGSVLDIPGLERLNKQVLASEIARHSRDRVNNSRVLLARAQRLGDDARIKAEKDELEHAIESQDRLAELFRLKH